MPIELEGHVVQLPPERFVPFALEWALWKAQHGHWDHVKEIIDGLWAPLAALNDHRRTS